MRRNCIALAALSALAACSFPTDPPIDAGHDGQVLEQDGGSDATLPEMDGKVPSGTGAVVGNQGGSLELDGTNVEIPEEALPVEAEVQLRTVAADQLPTQPPLPLVSDAIELSPHGQLFDKAVRVQLPYRGEHAPGLLKLLRLEDDRDVQWEVFEEATFDRGTASFETMTFGYYAVVVAPNEACFPGPAVAACNGACNSQQYCADSAQCAPVVRADLCGNQNIYALHNGETQVDEPAVDAMASAFAAHCRKTSAVAAHDDASFVSQCSGELLVGSGNTVLMAGGPVTQRALLQLDRRLSPVYFEWEGSTHRIKARSGTSLIEYQAESVNDGHDFLVIQMFPDTVRGALIISAFGEQGAGTRAASWYFSNVVVPGLSAGNLAFGRYVILEWSDDGNLSPDANDTWTVRASDPTEGGSTRAGETPWQSNLSGTLQANTSDHYAMGYKFTPQLPGRVTALGGFFEGSKLVKLFRGSTQLAAVRVKSANDWAYVDITPVPVEPGTQYTVAVYLAGSGGNKRSSVTPLPRTFGSVRIDAATQISTLLDANAIPTADFTPNGTMLGQADVVFEKD